MRLDWILLAEGVGTNATGAATAISINSNVVATSTLPTTTKRVVLAHFIGEPGEAAELAGKDITVSARALSPSGAAIFANSAAGKFAVPLYPDLPSGVDIAIELQLRVTEYGPHEIVISAEVADGTQMEGRTSLYVMEPVTPLR